MYHLSSKPSSDLISVHESEATAAAARNRASATVTRRAWFAVGLTALAARTQIRYRQAANAVGDNHYVSALRAACVFTGGLSI